MPKPDFPKLPDPPTPICKYDMEPFSAPIRTGHTISHDVYSRGEGKVLVLIQELPGIGQETLALADRFVVNGYKVYLPHLFGPIGKLQTIRNLFRVFCMRKEFKLLASNKSSPIVDWLKALCQKVKADNGVKGVATIGMCLTGNFAMALMADDSVLASYASQPSLPILKKGGLHLSPEEVEQIKNKLDHLEPMHCGRFTEDDKCRTPRMKEIRTTFNTPDRKRMEVHEIKGPGHAVLTLDFDPEDPGHPTQDVLRKVMAYFDRSLAE